MYDERLLDTIREIINLGMGEAANALSMLVNSRIAINVPDIRILSIPEIHSYVEKEISSLGVYMSQQFKGVGRGRTILFYSRECSISLLDIISGGATPTSALSETGIATLNEIGNIVIGSCMTQIADALEARVLFDLPEVSVEVSEKYFQNLLKDLESSDKVILVKNEMGIREHHIRGHLFVLLSFEDFSLIADRLSRRCR